MSLEHRVAGEGLSLPSTCLQTRAPAPQRSCRRREGVCGSRRLSDPALLLMLAACYSARTGPPVVHPPSTGTYAAIETPAAAIKQQKIIYSADNYFCSIGARNFSDSRPSTAQRLEPLEPSTISPQLTGVRNSNISLQPFASVGDKNFFLPLAAGGGCKTNTSNSSSVVLRSSLSLSLSD